MVGRAVDLDPENRVPRPDALDRDPAGPAPVRWEPIKTAPSNTRVLVCGDKGHVQIARLASLRWYDDADTLIGRPRWWMPLPAIPSEKPPEEAKPRGRKPRS